MSLDTAIHERVEEHFIHYQVLLVLERVIEVKCLFYFSELTEPFDESGVSHNVRLRLRTSTCQLVNLAHFILLATLNATLQHGVKSDDVDILGITMQNIIEKLSCSGEVGLSGKSFNESGHYHYIRLYLVNASHIFINLDRLIHSLVTNACIHQTSKYKQRRLLASCP